MKESEVGVSMRTRQIDEEDVTGTKVGAILLIVSTIIILVGFAWHPKVAATLSGVALAEAMVASPLWAEMHLLGAFGVALAASAYFVLSSSRGVFGTGAGVRASLSLLFVASLLGSIGFVVDGQRAYIAPAVVRGEDLALFNALTFLWDDRGLAVITTVFQGVGVALLGLAQVRTPTVSPTWASLVALVGGLLFAGFGLFVFGLRIFPLQILAFGGLAAYGWLLLVGALALRRSRSANG